MHRRSFVLALLLASSGVLAQSESLHQQAVNAERDGKNQEAVKLYVRAARAGEHRAATRLGEIYEKGLLGVAPDYAESLRWHNAARVLGGGPPMIGDFPNRGRGY